MVNDNFGLKIKEITIVLFTLLLLAITLFSFNSSPAVANTSELAVTKMVNPDMIYIGGGSPDTTTITISVQGYGGTLEETLPIDIVYAIDSSGSMDWNDPTNLRLDAAKTFTDLLDPTRDQAGVISWDNQIDFTYGLTNDFNTLKTWIDAVDAWGGTDPDLGLHQAIFMLDANTRSEDSAKVIILLSDGAPSGGTYTPHGEPGSLTDDAAFKGYTIYSIGLSIAEGSIAELLLKDMAQWTGGIYYSSPSPDNLGVIFDEILGTIITSTAPYDVDVVEVTETYIIDEGSFSITPDTVVEIDGKTEITWVNVAQYVGNNDNRLSADETFTVTFSARAQANGMNYPDNPYPIEVEGHARVNYYTPKGDPETVNIPQAYLTINKRYPIMLTLSVSQGDVNEGDSISVSGTSDPALPDKLITLTYTKPDSTIVTRTVTTGPDGTFNDTYTPTVIGTWDVTASWEGDITYEDASSQQSFKTHEKASMQDPRIFFSLKINEKHVIDAQTETNAILLNPEEELTLVLDWITTETSSLKLHYLDLEFTFLDLTVYSHRYDLGIVTEASSSANQTLTLDLGPILKPGGVNLISGVYKVTCTLTYETLQTADSTHELAIPFYMKMETNILTSVVGIATVAGTALSVVTALGAAREVTTTIQTARTISNAFDVSKLLELEAIPNGLNISPSGSSEWMKVGDLPKETIKRMYESAKKHWDGKKCPKCKAIWPKNATKCAKCGITLLEAEKFYSETVVKLTEKAKMPIYKTAGGVGVKVLARLMGVDTMMVNAVLKTMLDSGLAKSKVSRRFIINKFIVNGSKLVVSAIIFLQISGLKVFGINYLILSIVLGATISFVVGTLVNRMLKY